MIYVYTEPDSQSWCNHVFSYCCQLQSASTRTVDMSAVVDEVGGCI